MDNIYMDNNLKKVTIYDIAKEAGVSASQVSRAISGKGYVSQENRAKIDALVEKYHYRPNAMARNLQKGKSNMVGFLIPHIASEYFGSVYYEFEKEMTEKGYITIVFNGKSNGQEEIRILRLLEEIRVDVAVIMGGSLDAVTWDAEYIQALRTLSQKIPCVLCAERADELNCFGAYTNIDMGFKALIEHLAEMNYRSLGILGGLSYVYPSVCVQKTIEKYAVQYGIETKPEWRIESSYNANDGEEAMKKLLKQKELPSVVCCINDDIAIGAMGVAMDAGLDIPGEIAFAGYDNIRMSHMIRPKLTTVEVDFGMLGHGLVEAVENSLEGKKNQEVILTDSRLVVRGSTRKE